MGRSFRRSRQAWWPHLLAVVGLCAASALGGMLAQQRWPQPLLGESLSPQPVHSGVSLSPGPVSVGFAQDMAWHHERALNMAKLATTQGSSNLRPMAQASHAQWLRELGGLEGWLQWWQAAQAPQGPRLAWMRQAYAATQQHEPLYAQFLARGESAERLPGAVSDQELLELSRLHGDAFDQRYLSLMVRHHQHALIMARFVLEHGESDTVRTLAASMVSSQGQDIRTMTSWMKVATR